MCKPETTMLSDTDLQRYEFYQDLSHRQYPNAKQAYLVFISAMLPNADEYELLRIEDSIDENAGKTRTKKEQFINSAREASRVLLNLPPDTSIDPIELLLYSSKVAHNSCLDTALALHGAFSTLFREYDDQTATNAVKRLVELTAQLRIHDSSTWHWKDALAVFNQNPDLYAVQYPQ